METVRPELPAHLKIDIRPDREDDHHRKSGQKGQQGGTAGGTQKSLMGDMDGACAKFRPLGPIPLFPVGFTGETLVHGQFSSAEMSRLCGERDKTARKAAPIVFIRG
ncbi:hypothetical protein ACQZ5N_15760 [Agrobacterium sp. 22-221-1]